jgi:hypothetical protein
MGPGSIQAGMAVLVGSSGGGLISVRCDGASATTAFCNGVVIQGNDAFGVPVIVQYRDIATLTVAQWNNVIAEGSVVGLTTGAPYFVSDTAPGKITATPPVTVGHFDTIVGWALSPTELLVQPSTPLER